MLPTMLNKTTSAAKPLVALLTLEWPCSDVDVHVSISAPFQCEHFGAEIAFEFWWGMGFAVNIQILWLCERLQTDFALKGLCSRV